MSNNKSKSSRHSRDISSKTVFRNPVLCAQFIRDNINVPILKNVRPEDIEDVSERYLPYLGATDAETKQCVRKVRGREMGYLFENMEKMNIQEERKKTAEARKELEEMRMKLEETQEKLEKAQRKTDEAEEKGIRMLIESFQEMGISKEDTVSRLADKVESGIRIRELVDRYWR